MINGKRVLIAGMAGSVGSELTRQLCKDNKVFGIDTNETEVFDLAEELQFKGKWVYSRVGDICNSETVDDVFSDFKPHVVINCAARKHVKPMETTPMEAVSVNIVGNYNLIAAAKRWKVNKYVFVSTDKAVASNSIMGATKRCSEIITKNQGKGFVVVRFGNIMGSRGSVIPFWQKQMDHNDPITVTDARMERYMMTIEEACTLVIKAMQIGKGGEIIVLDMGKRINILDLAKNLVNSMGRGEIKMIGIRPGETLTEELMTIEEQKRAEKKGRFWIIH